MSTTTINVTDVNFTNDFAEVETGKANEKIFQKITGNIDQPSSYRVAIDDVKNVYANTDIQPALYSVLKKGKRLLVSFRDTVRRTNDTTGVSVDYPIQANLVLQYPVSADIDAEDAWNCLLSALGAVIHGPVAEGSNLYDELNKLMRGSLDL